LGGIERAARTASSPEGEEIVPGLWRWSAPHPEWDPEAQPGSSGDWDRLVGCVLYELPERVVLIDPLLPAEPQRAGLLAWLDRLVDERAVSILTTIHWHSRSRAELARRYRGRGSRAWNYIPPQVRRRPLRGAGETVFWLPGVAALVVGDRLVGAGRAGAGGSGAGGSGAGDASSAAAQLRVCPESWLAGVRADRAEVAALLEPLTELPIERVLVSHGAPVLAGAHHALVQAIAEARGRYSSGVV